MCDVCGCSHGGPRIEGHETPDEAGHHRHEHPAGHGHGHPHAHDHGHGHEHDGSLHFGLGPARAHAPGLSQARMVKIEQDIQAKNDAYAARNRARLEGRGILALNLVSSPGSGKTTLLTATLERLAASLPVAVIEGDQQTANDAERIRATGVAAIQINTGKGCHLDAHMVGHAIEGLPLEDASLLFIENVGNLVCPAAFDLGEAHKVLVLSVTEGDDKPLKYPDMFAAADLVVLNKVDLLPHVDFDVERCSEYARRIKPGLEMLLTSARSGDGLDGWLDWLRARRREVLARQLERLTAQAAAVNARLEATR